MRSPAPVSSPLPAPALRFEGISDLHAVSEVIAGNREMFEVIVRRYNPQLYRVGMAYLRNHAQTEDAMQNTYLKAFMKLKSFKGTAAFGSWLTRIMINECLMTLRASQRFNSDPLDDDHQHFGQSLVAEPVADPIHREEMKALLEQSIAVLPRSHRAVYLLREVQELSTAETAECLGMSEENVKVCLHRAREGLKTQLLKSSAGLELFEYAAVWCDPMTARVMRAVLATQVE